MIFVGFVEDFINTNYLAPLCNYYTPIGTLTYGIILVAAVAAIYKLLEKMKINVNKKFFIALLPFIIYGGWTRALRDNSVGIYSSQAWWWCSPPIYFVIAGIALLSLLISLGLQKFLKIDYWKTMFVLGLLPLAYNFTITNVVRTNSLIIVFGLMIFWSVALFAISKYKPNLLTKTNAGITLAHMLDASSSFTAVQFFGYCEQHILNGILMGEYCNVSSLPALLQFPSMPWMIFLPKLLVVPLVLHIIDKENADQRFKNFLKIIVLILGLALGIRDMLTVALSVE